MLTGLSVGTGLSRKCGKGFCRQCIWPKVVPPYRQQVSIRYGRQHSNIRQHVSGERQHQPEMKVNAVNTSESRSRWA